MIDQNVDPVRTASRTDLGLIFAAAWLRSFGIGLLGVILGVFLYRRGLSSIAIGVVLAAGIAGSAAGTIFVTFRADAFGRRRTLCCLSFLTALGAAALVFNFALPILVAVAFLGMLNGMGTDRSAAYALEQALIPSLVPDDRRTWSLAWYSLVLDASGALGALAAALPLVMQRHLGLDLNLAYRYVFLGYAAINLASAGLYLLLSPQVEHPRVNLPGKVTLPVSQQTKSTVKKLSALFAIDAFGGGFLIDALVAYWFFRRFGIAENNLAVLFFAVHILNAHVSSGCCVAGKTNRPDQNHDLHAPAFQHLSDCGAAGSFANLGDYLVLITRVAGRDGRSHAAILCGRRGAAGGTDICQRRNQPDAQRGVGCVVFSGWRLYADRGIFRTTAAWGRAEDSL